MTKQAYMKTEAREKDGKKKERREEEEKKGPERERSVDSRCSWLVEVWAVREVSFGFVYYWLMLQQ